MRANERWWVSSEIHFELMFVSLWEIINNFSQKTHSFGSRK